MATLRFELVEENFPAAGKDGVRTGQRVEVHDDGNGVVSIISTMCADGKATDEEWASPSVDACIESLLESGNPVASLLQYLFQDPKDNWMQKETELRQLHDQTATFDWRRPFEITLVVDHADGSSENVTFVLDHAAAAIAAEEAELQATVPKLIDGSALETAAGWLTGALAAIQVTATVKDPAGQQENILGTIELSLEGLQRLVALMMPKQQDALRLLDELRVLLTPHP